MNKNRRTALQKLAAEFEVLKGKIEDCKNEEENYLSEEQDYYDNMPEGLQGGDKGEAAQTAIFGLETLVEKAKEAIIALEEVASAVDDATQ